MRDISYIFLQVEKEKMKTFGCLCCESGPLNMKVTLNKSGFVPGEFIDIKAEVNEFLINHTVWILQQMFKFLPL